DLAGHHHALHSFPTRRSSDLAVPDAYRGTPAGDATTGGAAALGEQKWWEVFQDEQLRQLIAAALQQNWDARIAATRVFQARAQRSEEHTSELQSPDHPVCRLL